jgi:hypothetical protein
MELTGFFADTINDTYRRASGAAFLLQSGCGEEVPAP